MNNFPKIYISPINKSILMAIQKFDPNRNRIGYIVSQRQHTNHGGYVSKNITDVIFNQGFLIERDHFCMKDFDKSMIEYDASKFDIIHIDPWYFNQYNINETKIWIKDFLDFRADILFEFGTEDFIKELTIAEYKAALDSLGEYLGNILYLVSQGGSVVFDLQNISPIDVSKTESFINFSKSLGIKTKRHNCDFHTDDELKILSDLGVSAYNYAPEFTYISNKIIFNKLSPKELEIVNKEIIEKAPWHRWLNDTSIKEKNALACLHYVEYLPEVEQYILESESEVVDSVVARLEEIWRIVS